MFAPKVAKPQTKTAEGRTTRPTTRYSALVDRRLSHDPVEQALFLQRTIGNQATLRLLAQQTSRQQGSATENTMTGELSRGASWDFSKIPPFPPERQKSSPQPSIIQRKLVVGQTNDPLEHEADRMADQVMRMPAPEVAPTTAPPRVSHKCDPCEAEERLQTKEARPQSAVGEAPGSVHEALSSPGQPLDAATRAYFESRFGYDFSKVRVHIDGNATESAREVNALAYTIGPNIVFGEGRFTPETPAGRRLLAHELAHVVQRAGESGTTIQRAPLNPTPQVDPRATPGHRDPLIKNPASGEPLIEVTSEGTRSVSWSWEVERPGTPASGGYPIREQVYWANFEVDAQGVMRVSARMVSPSGQFRAPEWTLRSKFKEALDLFDRRGVKVTAFEAEWGYMDRGEMSANLQSFFGTIERQKGVRPVDAARATPSGKVALESGFTEVSTPSIGMEHNKALERPSRTVTPTARVRFSRPSSATAGESLELSLIEPEVATPATWRPRINISARTVGFGGGFKTVAATFGEFALTVGLAIAFDLLKVWMIRNAIENKYKDRWKAVGPLIDAQIEALKPDIAKLQLKLDKGEKVFANTVVKVIWEKHRISSHFESTEWEEPEIFLADIYLMTRSVERERSYEAEINYGTDRYPNMVSSKIDEFTRGFEMQVYSDQELEEFRDLSADYIERKRKLDYDPSNPKLRDEVRTLREQIVHTYGSDVWYLELQKATGTSP